ncbi:UDP-N-acetylglucosamine diphosphorylase/glucosamine-1-phosphate N-acetyltransferase [Nonlabens dokdonensis]|jgi:UDP-N-acetylglucosamine diphosphorylase/glucosamine-1-phosphate N-acetyltransferase|uniref:UDP-N-acetylglucosamine diphosphorylase/glucosamine-1-phosphate N-acetyltransferase n=2 Tax=Nonlabens dokdonensis TaxID=328515 RepID=A0ABX5PV02_9FLAO|nr:GlmU family protein [Nonlabens dokdonensis]AGC78228.1 putative sugar nucleotidyltransferase [Nonlabens dokdonensis DSW-6]PZX37881.1 UDP-N-acetylglucosamine diphosphorylase/glucosamine-1-phosphate N-acetyltransferase [Nonlabens dokdonensis]
MNFILSDFNKHTTLLPFTYTRPTCELRCGILTLREKWEKLLGEKVSFQTEEYLQAKYPLVETDDNIVIAGNVFATAALCKAIKNLKPEQKLLAGNEIIAYRVKELHTPTIELEQVLFLEEEVDAIDFTWDIFAKNGKALEADFDLITAGRKSQPIPDSVNYINEDRIFIEEGAQLQFATLNASTGSIYIGKDAEVMEGSIIRGAFALCDHSSTKLGTKVYGPTTVGPHSKIGGEVSNSVIFGFSNKGHEGFLGNSVLGEWCNLGADTNTSNLKNNYAEVKLWSYETGRFAKTGLQFCGLMMGDHSKCGINTMFNTGTVIGVSANIYGAGYPRNFIPSFNWGGPQGNMTYKTNKAYEVADVVMKRRGLSLEQMDIDILDHIFEATTKYRKD